MVRPLTVAVAGPTGSGKTALGLALAASLGGEIVGCDSVQLYRGFDVGAAKPSPLERAQIPHHLVDVLAWDEDCDAARYAVMAKAAIAGIHARGRAAVIVGGTGLYLRALQGDAFHADLPQDSALRAALSQLALPELYARLAAKDPARAAELHPNDRFRVARALEITTLLGRPVSSLPKAPASGEEAFPVLVIDPPRAALHEALAGRTAAMLAHGLVAEVTALLSKGVAKTAKPMQSIGYRQVLLYLAGEISAAELPEKILAATRQYAKRQCTWFRGVLGALKLAGPELAPALAALKQFQS